MALETQTAIRARKWEKLGGEFNGIGERRIKATNKCARCISFRRDSDCCLTASYALRAWRLSFIAFLLRSKLCKIYSSVTLAPAIINTKLRSRKEIPLSLQKPKNLIALLRRRFIAHFFSSSEKRDTRSHENADNKTRRFYNCIFDLRAAHKADKCARW